MKFSYRLGIIGYGNMAQAIVGGILKSAYLKPEEILISDNHKERLLSCQEQGFGITETNRQIVEECEYVLLAVKPQSLEKLSEELKGYCRFGTLISILAGVRKDTIRKSLCLTSANIARIMPNTPAKLGEGMTLIDAEDLTKTQSDFVFGLFRCVGKTIALKEDFINAATAISGSGPAYFYLFIQGLKEAGIKLGLTPEVAETLAAQTAVGSGKMVLEKLLPIETLIQNVCSKGGTTIEAVQSFQNDALDETILRAVNACFRRATELEGPTQ